MNWLKTHLKRVKSWTWVHIELTLVLIIHVCMWISYGSFASTFAFADFALGILVAITFWRWWNRLD